ncbi:MAG: alpha/beta hydrolase domain-containing protein [Pseudomonadales bacterium]
MLNYLPYRRGCSLLLISLLVLLSACDNDNDETLFEPGVNNAEIEGPIAGNPSLFATGFDLADVGYEQAEYFISGAAESYINSAVLESDGKWSVQAADSAQYKSRIVVYRPIDATRFNGTVLIEWLNVSAGLDTPPDWTMAHVELIRKGYAWVGVSAQLVGIEGREGTLVDLSLKASDPERYGSLSHPCDSFSYDIYSQAARAVRNPVGTPPLGELQVERMIAIGESQSAFRLTTYINAFAPQITLFDAYLIHARGGSSAPLSQAPQAEVNAPTQVLVRDDLAVPVLTFQAETDLLILGSVNDRQPDSTNFRLWEVAGTAHADTYSLILGNNDIGGDPSVARVFEQADAVPGFITCTRPINAGHQHWVLKAAINALDNWVITGEPAPEAPRLNVENNAFVLDSSGNVTGGIRTPYVDAPVAVLSGLGQEGGTGFCNLFGTTSLFDDAKLAELYPTNEDYVAAVTQSTDNAVNSGFILPEDGELIKAYAADSNIGGP